MNWTKSERRNESHKNLSFSIKSRYGQISIAYASNKADFPLSNIINYSSANSSIYSAIDFSINSRASFSTDFSTDSPTESSANSSTKHFKTAKFIPESAVRSSPNQSPDWRILSASTNSAAAAATIVATVAAAAAKYITATHRPNKGLRRW